MIMMDEARQRLAAAPEGEILLVDVRSFAEWQSGHLPGAIHIPLDQLAENLAIFASFAGKDIFIYCHVGGRAEIAVQYLRSQGEMRATNISGVSSWKGELIKD